MDSTTAQGIVASNHSDEILFDTPVREDMKHIMVVRNRFTGIGRSFDYTGMQPDELRQICLSLYMKKADRSVVSARLHKLIVERSVMYFKMINELHTLVSEAITNTKKMGVVKQWTETCSAHASIIQNAQDKLARMNDLPSLREEETGDE